MTYELRLVLHSLWLAVLAAIGEQQQPGSAQAAGAGCIAVVVALYALEAIERRIRQ